MNCILRFPLLFKRYSSRSSQRFLLNPTQKQYCISELNMGKMFNCTSSWNWKQVPIMMVSRIILKWVLKLLFRLISSRFQSQSNLGKLAIKYKIGLRLFLFFTSGIQNIWCISHSTYHRVSGKRKWISLYQKENI